MCRCCQSCLEDLYWNCIEEKFCYDESIANYNPDEDDYIKKPNNDIQQNDNNNVPICSQPLNRNASVLSSKIHEEDYRREIQTSVPILAPEILAVFANSQIFHDHQPKLTRVQTKPYLPGIHGKEKETDEEKLIKKLEDDREEEIGVAKEIKFTIAPESPPEARSSISPKKFSAILEEDSNDKELILRPKISKEDSNYLKAPVERLRSVQSVPYFSFRPASDTDIFSISGSLSKISMTPEIPSISYSTLPKNYEDTPTIEKYKESQSLYSIQTANTAKAIETDYSMPRYFRKSGLITQSNDNFTVNKNEPQKRTEKSKRLKNLRDTLPPLLIHSVRQKLKDDGRQVD